MKTSEKKEVKEKAKKEDSQKVKNIKFHILAIFCIIIFCASTRPTVVLGFSFLGEYCSRIPSKDIFWSGIIISPYYSADLRCLSTSYMKIPAATEALSELIFPSMGSFIIKSHFFWMRALIPKPSEPITRAQPPVRSVSQ